MKVRSAANQFLAGRQTFFKLRFFTSTIITKYVTNLEDQTSFQLGKNQSCASFLSSCSGDNDNSDSETNKVLRNTVQALSSFFSLPSIQMRFDLQDKKQPYKDRQPLTALNLFLFFFFFFFSTKKLIFMTLKGIPSISVNILILSVDWIFLRMKRALVLFPPFILFVEVKIKPH